MTGLASSSDKFEKREAQILNNIKNIENNLQEKAQVLQNKFTSDATQAELTVRAKAEQFGRKAEVIAAKVKKISLTYQMKHNPSAVLWAAAGLGLVLGRIFLRKQN